jgi:hypothetical protein
MLYETTLYGEIYLMRFFVLGVVAGKDIKLKKIA